MYYWHMDGEKRLPSAAQHGGKFFELEKMVVDFSFRSFFFFSLLLGVKREERQALLKLSLLEKHLLPEAPARGAGLFHVRLGGFLASGGRTAHKSLGQRDGDGRGRGSGGGGGRLLTDGGRGGVGGGAGLREVSGELREGEGRGKGGGSELTIFRGRQKKRTTSQFSARTSTLAFHRPRQRPSSRHRHAAPRLLNTIFARALAGSEKATPSRERAR